MKVVRIAAGTLAAISLVACSSHPSAPAEIAQTEAFAGSRLPAADAYVIREFPVLDRLIAQGRTLDPTTIEWMEKWKNLDLEKTEYVFTELSGSTSLNLKVDKRVEKDGVVDLKSRGSFVTRNGAANPNTEIAYFNLAAILGWERIYRPAARFELGRRGAGEFRRLIGATAIKGTQRLENKARILKAIDVTLSGGSNMKGTMKAKKHKTDVAIDAMANAGAAPNGAPKSSHAVIMAVQAGNPLPSRDAVIELKTGYKGKLLDLAHEYSVQMTLDAVFSQWDRYSGGNVVAYKDEAGAAHFYGTDNGGADLGKSSSWTDRNLGWFSRYDRKVIDELRKIYAFLGTKPGESSYLTYDDPALFLRDLGLYYELTSEQYIERVRRNIGLLLNKVQTVEKANGAAKTYFPDML